VDSIEKFAVIFLKSIQSCRKSLKFCRKKSMQQNQFNFLYVISKIVGDYYILYDYLVT